jgi:membrane-associated protein
MIGPMDEDNDRRPFRDLFVRRWGALLKWLALIVLALALVVILVSIGGDDGFAQLDPNNPSRTYFFVFFLVAADAVIPIFPGETTLNAASTFAANGDLQLWLVIVLGAFGAIVGDSTLYWIARRSSARITPQLERARKNERVAAALDFLDRGAPVLLVFGRYVPGLRFVINATMGMNRYPYGKYLPWSALGAVLWSTYTCLLAYKVGSSLDNYPLASVYISGLITTVLMAVIFLVVRRRDRRASAGEGPPAEGPAVEPPTAEATGPERS